MRFALTDVISGLLERPIPERSVNAMLRCPLPTHPERHSSFSINLDKGLWLCHACGERGGISKLARLLDMEVDENDITVRRALELAQAAGYEEPPDFWESAVRFQFYDGDPIPAEVRAFCKSRAINKPALYKYRIGWDADKRRIQFPYWDDGKCVALKYRYVDKEGTRFNKGAESGSKMTLMNVDEARGARLVFICEGESDTLALWSYLNAKGMTDGVAVVGMPGANAASGDRWELWALDLLWSERVYLAFDGDSAGDLGADKAAASLGEKAVRLRPPDGYDLSQYLVEGGTMKGLGLSRRDIQPDNQTVVS